MSKRRAVGPARAESCATSRHHSGEQQSPYDDTYFDQARALDIGHLVPLTGSWDSGACTRTTAERQAYANDRGDTRALIAVSATSRSKSDQDPAIWQPPAAGYRCTYATGWIAIQTRWRLTVDPAEQTALTDILNGCPNTPVAVTRAR
ncbi:GmrSD restriction endonuclease domain-containing protein [Streptomyces sp. NBC_01451]|uniref:GmrSD restriction endonuclease domain-containing protein n=1 Tax=Streptomyces sp. NBC_01451 TaxID=2903872 RepID=UPI002E326C0C|nr:DUF1524 domain-containing protein [Streptomyces sp. NBC_01451]